MTTVTAREVATLVNGINQAAGNVGVTVKNAQPLLAMEGADSIDVVRDAFERMAAGSVPAVMVRGANPVHTLPGLTVAGQRMSVAAFESWRMRDGQCAEHWLQLDRLGLLQQLGAVVAGAPAPRWGAAVLS